MTRDVHIFIALVAISSLAMLLVPSPDFPVNDEWMFARSIDNYFQHGVLGCEGCTTSGVLLVSFGIVVTKIAGFSFDALRSVPILFGALSVGITFLLLKEFTKNNRLAVLASLLLLVNPVFYNISHIFMTDIPFLFFTVLSVYFSVKAVKSTDYRFFLLAAAATSAAIFLRQVAVAIPFAIFLFYMFSTYQSTKTKNRFQFPVKFFKNLFNIGKSRLFTLSVIVSIFLPVVLFGAASYYQIQVSGQYYSQEFDTSQPIGISKEGIYNTFATKVYFGFFFLPLIFIANRYIKDKLFILAIVGFSIISIASFVFLSDTYSKAAYMPFLSNIMNENGLGAINIPGQEGKDNYIPSFVWIIITALSIIAASVFSSEGYKLLKKKASPIKVFMFFVILASILTVLFKAGGFYDRYILLFIPFLAFIFVDKLKESKLMMYGTYAFIGIMFVFSVVGTMDYVNWQEVRWNEISNLQSEGIPKDMISGGFEFCLYEYGMQHQYQYWMDVGTFDDPGVRAHDWKFCPGEEYVVSFSETPEDFVSENTYEVNRVVDYCLVGNFICDEIFILKAI